MKKEAPLLVLKEKIPHTNSKKPLSLYVTFLKKRSLDCSKGVNMIYELVLLFRPDVSMADLGATLKDLSALIKKDGGAIDVEEYWGFRTLAYRVEKRSKAHYFFMGIRIAPDKLDVIRHYLKFHKGLLRFLLTKALKEITSPSLLYFSSVANALSGSSQNAILVDKNGDSSSAHEQQELKDKEEMKKQDDVYEKEENI